MNRLAILCIDDENIVLESLKEQLQLELNDENTVIEVAESGEEALEIAGELSADGDDLAVIIADFIMPGMNGDELLEKIHRTKPESKKILLTGQASLQGVSNAVNKANLYRYISKPWDKDDLILTVKEALRSFQQDKTIVRQNKDLKELNASLEDKVDQRTNELKELNATKDKFFSIIAHDLKNPFNTLIGFSELLLTNLDNYDKAHISDFVNIINSTSKSAYTLLENLLDWSRAQTGRLKMEPTQIHLKDIIEENVSLLHAVSEKKGVSLINSVDKSKTAFADENMIKTVIRNLVSNALKYTPKGGTVQISSAERDGFLETTVSDTGIGISEENLEKLFRIDVNFSLKGTEDETGTGLGLILCKEFVEKNKGKISVKSTPGKGSEFSFLLPLESV
jgi:two-component system, sensor histidine kinase and response regulator